jgi:2-polyprenyl-3-methyl-5-hydroxy-6-metoxy-1,4-benzoquinol methylase
LSATQTEFAADAITYHASLAKEWERRYQKRSFQMRQTVLRKSLEGRELDDTCWLDAGCGTGTHSRWLAARGCRVIGVDASSEMVGAARLASRQNCPDRLNFFWVQSIARLTMDDRSLDGVLCSSVLEYVPDPVACLIEFARVLRPGGLLVTSVPNRHSIARRMQLACHQLGGLWGQHWCQFLDYSRHHYSRREFEQLLTQHGFSILKHVPFGGPLPRLAQRSRRWAPLLMFVAQKHA